MASDKSSTNQPPVEKPVPTEWTAALERLMQVVDTLRSPGGCPWDQKQTVESLAPHLVEEAHEMADAVARGSHADTCEELGDLLMGVLMIGRVASEDRGYDSAAIAEGVIGKLIRRHPHVYGEAEVDGSSEVLRNWEAIKKQEKAEKGEDQSALTGVPRSLPALLRAYRVGQKASNAGFDWPDLAGPVEKIDEELGEFREALEGEDRHRQEEELGDLLFAIVNVARKLKIEPELALRGTVERFQSRFLIVEQSLAADGKALADVSLAEMNALWNAAKARENLGTES
ncbi:MAG: nucleoside triphosphate pyrophosphohydrolase [Planctomycetes bacterium]|nr:nucleoside triphosphate pyrophosphohydrolase [Planctomycetota bacterium]